MRRIPPLCLLSALFIFFVTFLAPVARCADEIPNFITPSKPAQAGMLALLKLMVSDLRQYASQGDTELKKMLETNGLDKDPDWEALGKDPEKSIDLLYKLAVDLQKSAANNSNAKAITQKYDTVFSKDIQILSVYQSVVKVVGQYAKAGDKELDALLRKDGGIIYTADTMAALQQLAIDLLDLSKTNAHAKEIVDKFGIKQTQPSP